MAGVSALAAAQAVRWEEFGPPAQDLQAHAWTMHQVAQHRMREAWESEQWAQYAEALLDRAWAWELMAEVDEAQEQPARAGGRLRFAAADRRRAEEIGLLVLAYTLQVRP